MLKKVKTAFALLMVTLVLCSCNNSGTSSNTTTQAENTVNYEAFVKDDIMYIRDDKGNAYEYNDGIYTDDDTGEEYIYVNSLNTFGGKVDEIRKEYNLTADVTDMDKRMEEINKLDEKNTERKGYKIPLSLLYFDSNANQYYFESDVLGNKNYYPENGIYSYFYNEDPENSYYIFAKDGTRISFKSIEDITE